MLDSFLERKKKEYELKVVELMIGRCYPIADVSDPRKKLSIFEEAEVYYRDHIHGVTGTDASHHNVQTRFPHLNDRLKTELSVFAEKMGEAGEDMAKIETVIRNFGINVNFSNDRLKTMLNQKF